MNDHPGDLDAGLRALISRGYQFVHPSADDGELLAVVGVRVHGDVVDVFRLHAEDDALAMRMPATEKNIFAPGACLWRSAGAAIRVLTDLLALPDPESPTPAPGCWIPGRPGRSKWVAAS